MAKVKEWVSTAIDPTAIYDAEDIVAMVARTIRKTIKYRQREVKGVQSPSLTLSAGSGSCRDMATLMLEALRTVGLPARFASGYLDCTASEAGRASTHAWAEAYLPSVGWIGYDPMSGEATNASLKPNQTIAALDCMTIQRVGVVLHAEEIIPQGKEHSGNSAQSAMQSGLGYL